MEKMEESEHTKSRHPYIYPPVPTAEQRFFASAARLDKWYARQHKAREAANMELATRQAIFGW